MHVNIEDGGSFIILSIFDIFEITFHRLEYDA